MGSGVSPAGADRDKRPVIFAVLACAVLASLLGWLIWSGYLADRAEEAAQKSERDTLNVLAANAAVLRAVQDAETGQRGYLLTGREEFLEPYERAGSIIPQSVDRLARLTSGSPDLRQQNQHIASLVERRLGQLSTLIAQKRRGAIDNATLVERLRAGKQTMDELRLALAEIEQLQRLTLRRSQAAARLATERAERWRGLLLLFACLLFLISAAALFRLARASRLARDKRLLEASNLDMEEGRRFLQTIIDLSGDAIYVKDRRGRIIFCNRKVEQITGKGLEELKGTEISLNAGNEGTPRTESTDRAVMATGERTVVEETILVNGEKRQFLTEKMAWWRGGDVVGMIGIGRDITDQRNRETDLEKRVARRTAELSDALSNLQQHVADREAAENKVRQMQRIEALGQLTGGIAHDFNNMLTIVKGALAMARRRLPEQADPQLIAAMDNADEGATRAAELTARLLAFARQQPLDPKAIEVQTLLRRTAKLLSRTLGPTIAVELDLCEEPCWISVDEAQFENALVNLAVNARDAMPNGGRLSLSCHPVGDQVEIRVSDNGAGMSAEIQERVFEPFFTTKELGKGTGLGLSQVHGFVTQSGGHIELESKPGKGTTLRLRIPLIDSPSLQDEDEQPVSRPTRCEGTILLVEDEPLIRRATEDALGSLQYRVISAGNGREALEKLESCSDIVLMLTDVSMPEMDGHQLAEQAQKRRPELPVILTTGYQANPRSDSPWPVISKPYVPEELATIIEQSLARSAGDGT